MSVYLPDVALERGEITTLEAVSRANVILQQINKFEKNFLIKRLAKKHLKIRGRKKIQRQRNNTA